MQKHLFAVTGKGTCGKTTVIKKINELYKPIFEQHGFQITDVKQYAGRDIAYLYTHPKGIKIGIFSHGDTASIIRKYCNILQDCDVILCASRHTKPQFSAVREICQKQNRFLHTLHKTGTHKTDPTEDDSWVIEQFKQKTKDLFSSLLP